MWGSAMGECVGGCVCVSVYVLCIVCIIATCTHICVLHRVLNTDNMSIVGLTIDYGFMDRYDPGHICNGSGLLYWYTNSTPNMCNVL